MKSKCVHCVVVASEGEGEGVCGELELGGRCFSKRPEDLGTATGNVLKRG